MWRIQLPLTSTRVRDQHEEDVYYVRVAPSTSGINLVSAASRLTHGPAGTFDVNMPLTGVSGVECRSATTYNAVFTFDAPVTSGQVTVIGGTATVGAITFSGNSMTAQLTGVTSGRDCNSPYAEHQRRWATAWRCPVWFPCRRRRRQSVVDKPDKTLVQGQANQPVTSANFREDLIADGRIKNADLNHSEDQQRSLDPVTAGFSIEKVIGSECMGMPAQMPCNVQQVITAPLQIGILSKPLEFQPGKGPSPESFNSVHSQPHKWLDIGWRRGADWFRRK